MPRALGHEERRSYIDRSTASEAMLRLSIDLVILGACRRQLGRRAAVRYHSNESEDTGCGT
jgi:hypothetical protein